MTYTAALIYVCFHLGVSAPGINAYDFSRQMLYDAAPCLPVASSGGWDLLWAR